jgi:hypothetical protein
MYLTIGKFSYYPQPPSKNDTQTEAEYYDDLRKIELRERYVDGLHINPTYTIAHLWHIKQLVKASEWRFVTDKDNSLMTAIYRVFTKEIRLSMHIISYLKQIKQKLESKHLRNSSKRSLIYLNGVLQKVMPRNH